MSSKVCMILVWFFVICLLVVGLVMVSSTAAWANTAMRYALESRKLLVTWMISWKSLPSIAGCEFVFPICSNQAYAVSGTWCSC